MMDRRAEVIGPDRFWQRVIIAGEGCWLWDGGLHTNGYGQMTGWDGTKRHTIKAHRLAYELLIGPVPDGLELDHLCRVRSCVRPDHLEPVTHAENVRRGTAALKAQQRTTCRKGHPLDPGNLRFHTGADGYTRRYCIACQRMARKRWDEQRRAEDAA